MYDLISLGQNAKKASIELIKLTEEKRAKTLLEGAKMLRENAEYLMQENAIDIKNAKEKAKKCVKMQNFF